MCYMMEFHSSLLQMAMLLKLQEAANCIESPDKEDPRLPKL